MTRLRKFALVAAAVVVLLVGALVAVVATFDPNAYKGLAIDWMKTKRDRTLVIGGPIELSVFPRLTVKLSDVTLSEHGRPEAFAHLGEVSLSVAVVPLLLRQRLEVDAIAARGLRATWRRTADGRTNIDDLLASDNPAEPPAEGGPDGEALAFDVSGVRFEDLTLRVQDAMAGVDGTLSVASLTTGRLADGAESPVELDAGVALKQPALTGRLRGKTTLALDLTARRTALRDMALAWQGDAFGVTGLDLQLGGDLAHDGAAGTVSAKHLDVKAGATLGGLVLEGSTLSLASFAYDPAKQRLAFETLKLRVAGRQDGHPLTLDLDWPTLAVEGERLSGGPLSGALSLKGPLALQAAFKSAAPTGSFQRIAVPTVATTFEGSQGPRRLAGTVQADLVLDAAAKAATVAPLAARLSITEPSLQPLQVKADGRVTASADLATWKLAGDINGNPFETDGRAGFADTPLSLDASATFQALDLNRVLPPEPTAPAAARAPAPGPGASAPAGDAAPVDLSALDGLQGRLRFRAGSFAYRQYRATDVAVDATVRNGALRVAPLAARLWGGRVNGSADATSKGRIAVRASAEGIDVQALLKDVADKDLLEGRGQVTVDLAANGRTVGALKSSLDGSAGLRLRDGAIKGINLAQRLRQARAALSMKADAAQAASATEKTDFSELSASFAVADGIARSSDLDVKSPFLRLGGEGQVDIPQARLDYTVRATVADTSKGQGGKDLEELRGVTVPVRLTGPLDAVQWQIQWSAVAADLVRSRAGRELEERLKGRLGEKLGLPPAGASAPAGAASRPEDVLKDRLRRLLK